jgi:hypothetical protein
VAFYNLFADGQANAGARRVFMAVQALKNGEDTLGVLRLKFKLVK